MKPVAFDYERPRDLPAAFAALREADGGAKIMAGGQSLGPMLNLRLVRPDVIVDITRMAELKRVEEDERGVTIGACVTHADVEDRRVPDVTRGALPGVARDIAYRAVRNRGTVGGSLVHADPAADWVSALAAVGAEVVIAGPDGRRTLPVEDLMVGNFEVALEPAEILEAVRIPRLSAAARWGYYKVCRKTGEFAHAIGAVLDDPERGVCRAVIGAIDRKPIVVADARDLIRSGSAADALLRQAGVADPIDRQIHGVAFKRAVAAAGLA